MVDILVNSAIDVSLARSIFEVIDGAKPRSSARSPSPPLERLELRVTGGDDFPGRPAIGAYLNPSSQGLAAFKQQWRVERDVRDNSREVLHMDDIGWTRNWLHEDELDRVRKHLMLVWALTSSVAA